MAVPPDAVSLKSRDPKTDDTLTLDGVEYEVTGRDTYKNDDGYKVIEWCCEAADNENYLLKEFDAKGGFRWFFTRWIENETVTLPDGKGLHGWLEGQKDPQPPPKVVFNAETYTYDDTTEGTDEDEDGDSVDKTTWDYWSAGRKRNLAVELWADEGIDFYNGTYIEAERATVTPAPRSATGDDTLDWAVEWGGPWLVAIGGVIPAGIFVFLMADGDMDFDVCLAIGGVFSLMAAYAIAAADAAAAASASAFSVVATAFVFAWFHPIRHPAGLAALILAPAVVVFLGRSSKAPARNIRFLAAIPTALPAAAFGVERFVSYAPAPNSSGQLFVALLPAILAVAVAEAVYRLIASSGEPRP